MTLPSPRPSGSPVLLLELGDLPQRLARHLERLVDHGGRHRQRRRRLPVQVARLARAGPPVAPAPGPRAGGGATSPPVDLHRRRRGGGGAVVVVVATCAGGRVGGGGGVVGGVGVGGVVVGARGGARVRAQGRLPPDLVEDLLQEHGEGGDLAGAQEGEGAALDLRGPVVRVRVEGVEEVVLDSGRGGGGQATLA